MTGQPRLTVRNAEVWNNKGLAYAALGRYQDALQCFNKALGLQPDFPEALKNKESVYGKFQVTNVSGTVTPTVTVTRTGTLAPSSDTFFTHGTDYFPANHGTRSPGHHTGCLEDDLCPAFTIRVVCCVGGCLRIPDCRLSASGNNQ